MACAERVGREVLHTSKKEKQEMACAEPPPPSQSNPKKGISTRQKEKSKK